MSYQSIKPFEGQLLQSFEAPASAVEGRVKADIKEQSRSAIHDVLGRPQRGDVAARVALDLASNPAS
jgi:hypothetical protein